MCCAGQFWESWKNKKGKSAEHGKKMEKTNYFCCDGGGDGFQWSLLCQSGTESE